jgi:DnaJ-class molecular chaperone
VPIPADLQTPLDVVQDPRRVSPQGRSDDAFMSTDDDLFTAREICRACEGSGRSSKGQECYPCKGTGALNQKERT